MSICEQRTCFQRIKADQSQCFAALMELQQQSSTWIWDLRRGEPGRCAVGEETPANSDQTILRQKEMLLGFFDR